jgi:hypothetical protein
VATTARAVPQAGRRLAHAPVERRLPFAREACRSLLDVSADDVEDQVDAADVVQGLVLEVDELHRADWATPAAQCEALV